METSLSKQRIIDEAFKLFSINGYDATSIGQITNAVGIKKASFYSHFESKKELLDTLVREIEERYEAYSKTMKKECEESIRWTAEDVFQSVNRQFEFLIHDSFFCRARNFLTIEQFRNPQLAFLQNKCEYIEALNYHRELIGHLVENEVLLDRDVEIMTYEFFSPIYVQFYRIQREPECKVNAMKIVEDT